MKLIFKKKIIYTLLLGCLLVTAAWLLLGSPIQSPSQYQFTTLKRGNIESIISSSGTLGPVTKIEVGTQVSGTINKVFVDFNDKVTKGEIIAILDSSLLQVAVKEARSGVLKAEAQLEESQASYNRSVLLIEKQLLSEADFLSVKTSFKNAQAMMISAKAALDRAEQNLKYAIIRSPIDGTVTDRSIEEGQTVAASFATPTLFTIAQDLSKMEIKALVDESDIGQIKEGQSVRFTVQAYPEKTFTGKVKQVRVQPTTTANVVNYTVIISAQNDENLLLPGMTATVDFIIESRQDVLLVPNAAFRYQPSESELAQFHKNMQKKIASEGLMPPPLSEGEPPKAPNDMKTLWYVDKTGALLMEPIKIGITDGTNTEVLVSHVSEGQQVISGVSSTLSGSDGAAKAKANTGGPPPPPMM